MRWRTRQCRVPTPINCRETALRRVLTVGNINSDATGFDMKALIAMHPKAKGRKQKEASKNFYFLPYTFCLQKRQSPTLSWKNPQAAVRFFPKTVGFQVIVFHKFMLHFADIGRTGQEFHRLSLGNHNLLDC